MTSAFLTLSKGQGHTTRSKVTDVEVSAFSECFMFLCFFVFRIYILKKALSEYDHYDIRPENLSKIALKMNEKMKDGIVQTHLFMSPRFAKHLLIHLVVFYLHSPGNYFW